MSTTLEIGRWPAAVRRCFSHRGDGPSFTSSKTRAVKRRQISGIVGTSNLAHQAVAADAGDAVFLFAVISLSLAIINLFPFLPLDGGHIFWTIVEKLRGRPIPLNVMERSGVVGFALIILVFLIGLTNDIGRLTGNGFQVR